MEDLPYKAAHNEKHRLTTWQRRIRTMGRCWDSTAARPRGILLADTRRERREGGGELCTRHDISRELAAPGRAPLQF